ncbi:MAG TPA: rhodanese-like domain-containing protein [Candidatus Binatia bacterium]|nr:rhodanese-like domain-containing protein [Candidatus Binatia bacterium]
MPVLLALGAVALAVVLWRLTARLRDAERQVKELRLLRREIEEVRTAIDRGLGVTRAHLAAVASGEPPTRDAILRGTPYRDVQGAAALALLSTPGLVVLDVRTPAEYASGHLPDARLIPIDELEDRLHELPPKDTPMLVHCAAGGRSSAACDLLGQRGWSRLHNLVGGLHAWTGPIVKDDAAAPAAAPAGPAETAISYRGGAVTGEQVVAAIRECYDPEIPLNIYDLGLVYGIDIDDAAIAIRMTLTSEACPSARTIPEDVRRKVVALGQSNVTVDVVWDPPWHPSRISADGKQKLGLV